MVAASIANLEDGQRSDLVEATPIGVAANKLTVSTMLDILA